MNPKIWFVQQTDTLPEGTLQRELSVKFKNSQKFDKDQD